MRMATTQTDEHVADAYPAVRAGSTTAMPKLISADTVKNRTSGVYEAMNFSAE